MDSIRVHVDPVEVLRGPSTMSLLRMALRCGRSPILQTIRPWTPQGQRARYSTPVANVTSEGANELVLPPATTEETGVEVARA